MRRLWLVALGLVAVFGIAASSTPPISNGASASAVAVRNPPPGQARKTATITVHAVGATMEFRTMGNLPAAFTVADGASQTFANLQPGTYVIVQAPPVGIYTQVGPDEYEVESGMQIACSMPGSVNQFDLHRGDALVCTYTVS